MTNATMFHFYYLSLIKLGIDFKSSILVPLRVPRDYFYKKGLESLPKDDAESAIWFDTFEVDPYMYSVNGEYGYMSKLYGTNFTKTFTDKVYENIELLSNKLLYEYSSSKELQEYTIEKYISLLTTFINEFHLNTKGSLLNQKNILEAHTNKEWYEKFKKLYYLQKNFFAYYKTHYPKDFNKIMEKKIYFSPFGQYHINKSIITTFILYYEKNNNKLTKKSMEYIISMIESKRIMLKLLYPDRKPTKNEEEKMFGFSEKQIDKLINKSNKGINK